MRNALAGPLTPPSVTVPVAVARVLPLQFGQDEFGRFELVPLADDADVDVAVPSQHPADFLIRSCRGRIRKTVK